MRILMLAQFYPPITGGIERHVHSLSTALAARGHQVAVATLWHKGLSEYEEDGNVRIYRLRASTRHLPYFFSVERHHSPPFPDPEVMLALRKIIAKEKPEIVHAHNWIVHSFLPIKSWSDARLVMTLHDCEMSCVQMRMMYFDQELCSGPSFNRCVGCAAHHYGLIKGEFTLFGNWLMNFAERSRVDMFLPVSRAVADANHLVMERSPFQVVPNFVPDDIAVLTGSDDPRLSLLPQDGYILQVGDLVRDKGINVLLEAYASLKSAPPLALIGRRLPESPKVLPPNVIIIENWPHHLVMHAWKRCIFGVVPSICLDACPTVTIEAMASGRPVIASRIGGIIDQVTDEETGILVSPGNADELRKSMERLISDPELCSRLGEKAQNRAVDFKAERVVNQIVSVYQSLWNLS